MLTLSFLFLTAIVSTVALAVLRSSTLKVPVVAITVLKLVNPSLQLAKVKLEVFIDLSHFKVLLLEVLSPLISGGKLLVEIDLSDSQSRQFFFSLDILFRHFGKLLL